MHAPQATFPETTFDDETIADAFLKEDGDADVAGGAPAAAADASAAATSASADGSAPASATNGEGGDAKPAGSAASADGSAAEQGDEEGGEEGDDGSLQPAASEGYQALLQLLRARTPADLLRASSRLCSHVVGDAAPASASASGASVKPGPLSSVSGGKLAEQLRAECNELLLSDGKEIDLAALLESPGVNPADCEPARPRHIPTCMPSRHGHAHALSVACAPLRLSAPPPCTRPSPNMHLPPTAAR